MQADEGLTHRDGQVLVHGEVFALPIDRGAEALHLVENGAAVVAFPLPHALDKGFAAKLLAAGAFGGQLALDHHLRGDAGMIDAGQPQGAAAGHAPPADEDVHLRLVEHVSHVQPAGDVGRRQQYRKGGLAVGLAVKAGGRFAARNRIGARIGRGLGEELLAHPVFGPVIFNGGGVVSFGQVVRHDFLGRVPDGLRKTLLQ
jgi:hypothetical protein